MKMINIKQLIIFIGLVLITLSGFVKHDKIATSSLNGYVHFIKGVKLTEENKWQEAITEYDLVIKYQPDYAAAYYNKAIVLEKLGILNYREELAKW